MKRMHRIVTVLAVLITFTTIIADCGGNSPTNPIITGTPTPTPTPASSGTPTPTPTPKPGTTPTPTPAPTISISVVKSALNPPAGSNVVVGQPVYVKFGVSGFTAGDLIIIRPSEDGVTPSPMGTSTSEPVASLATSMFSMQTTGKTVALLFYHYADIGHSQIVAIPNSTYLVTYNWVAPNPDRVVSIRPGGAYEPRDSGTVAPGTVISYRNDDNSNHQPHSSNSGMVDCHYLLPTETCTIVTYSVGVVFRVSVTDRTAEESHTFTVSP